MVGFTTVLPFLDTHEGLEKISTHAGNVTDVVANIVSNHSRIARIVFRDIHFNFSDEISTHVRSLGVDSTLSIRTTVSNRVRISC